MGWNSSGYWVETDWTPAAPEKSCDCGGWRWKSHSNWCANPLDNMPRQEKYGLEANMKKLKETSNQ